MDPAGILDAVFSGGFKNRRNVICKCYIGYLKFGGLEYQKPR